MIKRLIILFLLIASPVFGAEQTIKGGMEIPKGPIYWSGSIGFESRLLDAADERHAALLVAPRTGNIRKVWFRTGTVTTGATVDVRIETINTTTGDPSGTLFGTTTNVAHVIQDTDDDACLQTNALTADAAVTKGDFLAVVIVNPSGGNWNINVLGDSGGNAAIGSDHYTGGAWAKEAEPPIVALEYDDGTFWHVPDIWPACSGITTNTINSNSSPTDEISLTWTLPFPHRVAGGWVYAEGDGQFQVTLYDGVTNPSVTFNPGQREATAETYYYFLFPASASLSKDTVYRMGIRPTTTTNIHFGYYSVPSVAFMGATDGGPNIYASTREDLGSWSDLTTSKPFAGIILDAFDDGTGAGSEIIGKGGTRCYEVGSTVVRYAKYKLGSAGAQATSKSARIYDVDDTTTPSATVSDGSFTEYDPSGNPGDYRYSFTAPSEPGTGRIFWDGTVSGNYADAAEMVDFRDVGECEPPPNWSTFVIDANGRIDLGSWLGAVPAALDASGNVSSNPASQTMSSDDFFNFALDIDQFTPQLLTLVSGGATQIQVQGATTTSISTFGLDSTDPASFINGIVDCDGVVRKIWKFEPETGPLGENILHTEPGDPWPVVRSVGEICTVYPRR